MWRPQGTDELTAQGQAGSLCSLGDHTHSCLVPQHTAPPVSHPGTGKCSEDTDQEKEVRVRQCHPTAQPGKAPRRLGRLSSHSPISGVTTTRLPPDLNPMSPWGTPGTGKALSQLPWWEPPRGRDRSAPHLLGELGGFDLHKSSTDGFQVTALITEGHATRAC